MNRKAFTFIELLIIIVICIGSFKVGISYNCKKDESYTNKRLEKIEKILNDITITAKDRVGYYVAGKRVLIEVK